MLGGRFQFLTVGGAGSKEPSGPGEFHPRPLTDPDVTVSGHPARATHRRLPPAAEPGGLLPLPVGPRGAVEWPAPLAPRALPRFHATTAQSAPRRCIGTFGLAVPPLGPFPLAAPARFSRSARKPRLESCPLYAGRHLASQQAPARLVPGHTFDPGFGVIAVLSTRPRGFACAHLSSPHLTGAPAFSMTLTTGAFDPSRSWRFGASHCRATPKGQPSSSGQLRDAQGTGHLLVANSLICLRGDFNSWRSV
jgi:hypothetical protein